MSNEDTDSAVEDSTQDEIVEIEADAETDENTAIRRSTEKYIFGNRRMITDEN